MSRFQQKSFSEENNQLHKGQQNDRSINNYQFVSLILIQSKLNFYEVLKAAGTSCQLSLEIVV